MYQIGLWLHTGLRWLVLCSLVYTVGRALWGWRFRYSFTATDDRVRHITATIAHLQLMVGATLYFISPLIRFFFSQGKQAMAYREATFFGILHPLCMFTAIILITIGSALAKRRPTDPEKFRTILIWFGIALLLILLAIPWPWFSWVHRPLFRNF
ncbi:hypothetical protein [Chitinophaga nivalis]|uniref:Cytochrome B n=1 Tax=Chitinophaga nivalis TaxID=2991709 RepID=A0ABT3IQR7_9BACT|nr:hypothetical protein [Chitinophaga nivalis]MCW3463992.1 hypothetical protein [Chitinophaga nivalis]MCW3486318.1 hypothetical protein [Chitinophaga nivalis]